MNALILAAFALTGTAHANSQQFDSSISCHSNGINDGGYVFQVSEDRKTAKLSHQTFAGPRLAHEMFCEEMPVERIPDGHQNTLTCYAYDWSGVLVRVSEGGLAPFTDAIVLKTVPHTGGSHEELQEYGAMSCSTDLF